VVFYSDVYWYDVSQGFVTRIVEFPSASRVLLLIRRTFTTFEEPSVDATVASNPRMLTIYMDVVST
jgi:hypothetical protein